jgi:O-antigen/teichoic acid export membrane protein
MLGASEYYFGAGLDDQVTMSSLAQRFTHAVQWSVALSVATIVSQLGIAAVLARLLPPADFGLFAIASIAYIFVALFGDRSLIAAVIREPVLDRETVGAAVLVSWFLSMILATIMVLAAPLAGLGSAVNERHIIVGLVQLLSLSVLASGLGAPAQAIMQREYRFRELGLVQFAGIIFGAGALTIAFAFANYGPWSLVYGNIANMVIATAGCWWVVRDRWSISWHPTHMVRIGLVGVQMALLRALDVLWGQLPLIVSQIRLSSSDVGLYQRTQVLVNIGIQSTTGRVNAVLFPVIASRQHRTDLLRELIPALIGIYALFLFAATAFVAVMAPDIIALLLGPNWSAAVGPLVMNMIAYACLIVSQPASSFLEASAQFRPRIFGAGLGVAILLVFSVLFVEKYGLIGVAMAAVISAICTSAINIIAVVLQLEIDPRVIFSWMVPSAVVTGLLACALVACRYLLFAHVGSPFVRIAMMATISGFVFVTGFRLAIGADRRNRLAAYLLPGASHLTLIIAKIFGLSIRN